MREVLVFENGSLDGFFTREGRHVLGSQTRRGMEYIRERQR
jgi:hypothetical protein